jgi:glycosyltransferase involved in cell wall biosynthesis
MNIVFLCGSMEPGRDGVGDYVRRLAIELQRQGHQVAVVSLNDRHLTEEYCGSQSIGKDILSVLRLPASWTAKQRFTRAKSWISTLNPEFLSLQFVPYSFSPKGLPIRLSKQLANLGQGYRWHIMFHELWVGMKSTAPLKLVGLGWLQKQLVRLLILHLKPVVVHTQTRLYQAQLNQCGIKAQYLPLFANIPMLFREEIQVLKKEDNHAIRFVFFGGIYPGAPIVEFAQEAASYAKNKNISILLVIIGRAGTEQSHWVEVWQAAGLGVEILGEQPPERISAVLASSSIGLCTTPTALVEKSGSAAAMRGHGLPVLCVSQPWQPRGMAKPPLPSGIMEYQYGNFESCLAQRYPPVPDEVLKTSRELVATLTKGSY